MAVIVHAIPQDQMTGILREYEEDCSQFLRNSLSKPIVKPEDLCQEDWEEATRTQQ